MVVGGLCEAMLFQVSLGKDEERFRVYVLSFLIELCNEMKVRFLLLSSNITTQLETLDPQVATSPTKKQKSIIQLTLNFPSFIRDENKLDDLA